MDIDPFFLLINRPRQSMEQRPTARLPEQIKHKRALNKKIFE